MAPTAPRSEAHDPNAWMKQFADRIRAELATLGWTQEQLEDAAGFARGALSRLMRAKQMKVWPRTIKRIADALEMTPDALLSGLHGVRAHEPNGNLGGQLELLPSKSRELCEIDGYANAELTVGRRKPDWPVGVFEMARKSRLTNPPAVVTVEFLQDFISVLVEHVFQNPSGTVSKRASTPGEIRPRKQARLTDARLQKKR